MNLKKNRTDFFVYMMNAFILFGFSLRIFSSESASNNYSIFELNKMTQMPQSLFNFILTFFSVFVVIFILFWIFYVKLRKVKQELEKRNFEFEELNRLHEKTSQALTYQKNEFSKGLAVSERFYSLLIESANDGISYYDKDWNLEFANTAFYSLFGMERVQYDPFTSNSLIHPDDHDYLERRAEALKAKGLFEREIRIKHKDGHFVNLLTKTIVIRKDHDGEVIGALTISRDVTSIRQVHEELLKAKVEAEARNKLKTNFLANISHEIRTPLNSVVGFANLLLTEDISKEAKEEYIEHINHNSEKLLQIIGDIIDLSRLESSQIEINYEETSLNEIINQVIEETRQSIKRNEKPIILTVKNQFEDYSDRIFMDRMWLKRILNHLMDNAVKFTLEGSIELSYIKENDNILFKIKDTGIGINKENLGRIFEEFNQEINGHHRLFEGLGVGLTLAREVIGRMGGNISVQSEKGIGSEFVFTIPYRPAGRRKIRTIDNDQAFYAMDWSSKKCLIVDDNRDVLIYLNRILLDTGIKIITAKSGFEAIELVKSVPDINVILLDMQMPEMNGIEATREIRSIRKDLPIIAQTAFIFEGDKDIILEAGCDACLIKPIRKDHLLNVMSGFIKTN